MPVQNFGLEWVDRGSSKNVPAGNAGEREIPIAVATAYHLRAYESGGRWCDSFSSSRVSKVTRDTIH